MESQQPAIIEEIHFTVEGIRLAGTLHLPQTVKNPPVVIGLHGLLSNRSSAKQIDLAMACNTLGIAYFRIDHRGCGESEGEFESVTSLSARVRDLLAAVETLQNRGDLGEKIGLFGSSLGGTVCLAGASRLAAVSCVTLAAPIRSRDLHNAAKAEGDSRIPETFFNHQMQFDILEDVRQVRNLLIFHGDKDTVVPVNHAREIFRFAGEPKSLIVNREGDHRMTDPVHHKRFLTEASRWFLNAFHGTAK